MRVPSLNPKKPELTLTENWLRIRHHPQHMMGHESCVNMEARATATSPFHRGRKGGVRSTTLPVPQRRVENYLLDVFMQALDVPRLNQRPGKAGPSPHLCHNTGTTDRDHPSTWKAALRAEVAPFHQQGAFCQSPGNRK